MQSVSRFGLWLLELKRDFRPQANFAGAKLYSIHTWQGSVALLAVNSNSKSTDQLLPSPVK